jgi:hypothetical protein
MLDRIGHVNAPATDGRLRERAVQEKARVPDKRAALTVFFVTGLLANEHDFRRWRALSEHRPGRIFPQRGRATGRGLASQAVESSVAMGIDA